MATVVNLASDVTPGGDGTEPEYSKVKPSVEYAGDPLGNVTPSFSGQICLDTTNGELYIATDLTTDSWVPASTVV